MCKLGFGSKRLSIEEGHLISKICKIWQFGF
jgi:hypothetical protein